MKNETTESESLPIEACVRLARQLFATAAARVIFARLPVDTKCTDPTRLRRAQELADRFNLSDSTGPSR